MNWMKGQSVPLASLLMTQNWASQFKKDEDLLERVQWKAMKMIRGLKHLSFR